jgi:hypothetical protein
VESVPTLFDAKHLKVSKSSSVEEKFKTKADFPSSVDSSFIIEVKMNGTETIQESNVAKIVIGTNIIVKCLVISEPDINSIQWYKADNLIGWNKTINI